MPVTDKQVQDFEKSYKESLFKKVDELCSLQASVISSFEKFYDAYGIQGNFYNLGIAINNKINELSQKFKQAGTSIFSSKIEDYGVLNLNMVSTSFIGEAITNTFLNSVVRDVDLLSDLDSSLTAIQKQQALQKSSPIRNFFSKLRAFVMPPQRREPSPFQQFKEEFLSFQLKHNEIADQIYNYTLEENLIPSLVSYIGEKGYPQGEISGLLDECVVQDFEKLGLEHLLPRLNEELTKLYEEKPLSGQKSWKLPPIVQAKIQEHQQQLAEKYNLEQHTSDVNLEQTPKDEIKE